MNAQSQPDIAPALEKLSKLDHYGNWVFSHFEPYIHGDVLEVGAGIGNIMCHYIDKCNSVVGTELFKHKVSALEERFSSKPVRSLKLDIFHDDYSPYFSNDAFDGIVCVNVLEHIDDDRKALETMYDLLRDGGYLFLYVPAVSKLYGEMDRAVGHYRRYDRGDLVEKATSVGFKLIKKKYANFPGLLPYFIKGKLLKKKSSYSETISDGNLSLYNAAINIVRTIEKVIPPPIGLSEVVIVQKG